MAYPLSPSSIASRSLACFFSLLLGRRRVSGPQIKNNLQSKKAERQSQSPLPLPLPSQTVGCALTPPPPLPSQQGCQYLPACLCRVCRAAAALSERVECVGNTNAITRLSLIFVCLNTQNSAILKATLTKFSMQLQIY